MTIERVIIRNYRALRSTDVSLDPELNIIVGDNETGKSTLLEAINLALKCQLNRRPAAYELHPFLFNAKTINEFITAHKMGKPIPPPEILIELYLTNDSTYADLKGTNNSESLDQPGISLNICLDPEFNEDFGNYIADPDQINTVPVEYYQIIWQSFAGHPMNPRSLPVRSAIIDPSAISNTYAANKYVLEIVRDYLTKKQKVDLALSYRQMREIFLSDDSVKEINNELADKSKIISEKTLSVAMDTTTRASWETGVLPHLDDIPLTLVGKGEQNAVKIKLAMLAADACAILLMEEPENHLTHTNLNKLVRHISESATGKQLIITTHSSFVLNKLGIDKIRMFNGRVAITLDNLPISTKDYFKKLPGYDTLRLILSKCTILVEGPSDELIVQKGYIQSKGRLPIEDGIEVISVRALAFKRFLDIAQLLQIDTRVVTDNDGKPGAVADKYQDYTEVSCIKLFYGSDATAPSLESQILKANGRDKINAILGTEYRDDQSLLAHMAGNNKTDTALKIFESDEVVAIPSYINDAIK